MDVGALEHRGNVGGGLDERADVRVQRLGEPVLGAQLVELAEHADEVVPLRVGELESRRPAGVDDHRGDEHRRPGRGEQLGGRTSLGERRLALAGVVEHERDESADQLNAVAVEHLDERVRVAGQEPRRPELGGGDAERAHLAEHTVGGQHHAPPGNLADAPRDRCPANSVERDHGLVKFVARSISRRVP